MNSGLRKLGWAGGIGAAQLAMMLCVGAPPIVDSLEVATDDPPSSVETDECLEVWGPTTSGPSAKPIRPPEKRQIRQAMTKSDDYLEAAEWMRAHPNEFEVKAERIDAAADEPIYHPLFGPCQMHRTRYHITVDRVTKTFPRDRIETLAAFRLDHRHAHVMPRKSILLRAGEDRLPGRASIDKAVQDRIDRWKHSIGIYGPVETKMGDEAVTLSCRDLTVHLQSGRRSMTLKGRHAIVKLKADRVLQIELSEDAEHTFVGERLTADWIELRGVGWLSARGNVHLHRKPTTLRDGQRHLDDKILTNSDVIVLQRLEGNRSPLLNFKCDELEMNFNRGEMRILPREGSEDVRK